VAFLQGHRRRGRGIVFVGMLADLLDALPDAVQLVEDFLNLRPLLRLRFEGRHEEVIFPSFTAQRPQRHVERLGNGGQRVESGAGRLRGADRIADRVGAQTNPALVGSGDQGRLLASGSPGSPSAAE